MAASYDRAHRESEQNEEDSAVALLDYVPEGVEAFVPYKGNASELITQLVGGLRSGMSYCGATTIPQMRKSNIRQNLSSWAERELPT